VIGEQIPEPEGGGVQARLEREIQQEIRDQIDNVSGQDLMMLYLDYHWVRDGYRARYLQAASDDANAPVVVPTPPTVHVPQPEPDPSQSSGQPSFAPPPPPAYFAPPNGGSQYAAPIDGASEPETRSADPARLHDGFYLRLSAGLGSLSASFDDKTANGETLDGTNPAFGADFALGGSPRPGFVIGGALMYQGGNLDLRRGLERAPSRGVSLAVAGFFIDFFPAPRRGFHLGGLIGPAVLAVKNVGDGLKPTAGAGVAAWLGYDFWVGDEWSLGPTLKLVGAATGDTESDSSDLSATSGAALLSFSILYH
jgi:hypothetical protein